ncbi:MAG TPA: TadE/TadG family type IV pilus assembly protein [Candidatus Limnocylindrales bacterium]|nr:TadE/TadG family type IV pilus assembly protein [Candidatus Limnocylindrales bacterium]
MFRRCQARSKSVAAPQGRVPQRGQALVEFAIAFPVLMLIIGGIIQFGVILWAQNTLTQVARDLGRWEATQQVTPCRDISTLFTEADLIARNSSLIGYTTSTWNSTNYTAYPDHTTLPASPPSAEGVEAVWSTEPPSGNCPPVDNTTAWFVTIRVSHVAPIFFPWIPGNGSLSSTAQFRMEPAP